MLNVLIVDDEALVRTGIRHSVPWANYQMQVAAEAASVQEAIDVIHGPQRIDVVFTDIVMPGPNGLELLRWLRDHHPFITAVVLSYHNEFSYIQDALRLGVADYIVKTELDHPESIQSMHAIQEKALRNQQNRQELKNASRTRQFVCAMAVVGPEGRELALLPEDLEAASAHYPVNSNAWLLLYDRPFDEEHLLDMERRYGSDGILLTFDRVDAGPADLILAVSLFLSRDDFYERLPHLSVYSVDARAVLDRPRSLDGPEYVRLEQELSAMQWIWDPQEMERLLDTIRESRLLPSSVYNLFYCVQMQWRRFFPQNDIPAMFPMTGIRYWYQWLEWLNNFRTFTTTQSKLSAYAPEVVSAIQGLILWIDANFMNNITLTEASQKVNLSASYLSRCFKDITGRPFNRYIRDLRIDCSKKMLLQSNLSIRHIAEICGFQDQFYFDKVFKKAAGETPGNYRQRHGRTGLPG